MSERRTALLNSAEHAARRRGFDGFSYADLAAEVGIRKASIHHHFATKAVLASALIARYHDEMEWTCHEIDELRATGGGRLDAMISTYRYALDEGQSLCLCVALSISRKSLPEDLPYALANYRTMITTWLAAGFAIGQTDGTVDGVVDPATEAAAMLALMEGAQLAARVVEDVTQFDAALAGLQSRLTA